LLLSAASLGLHATPGVADKAAAHSLHNIGLIDQVLARVRRGQDSTNIDDQLFKVKTLVGYRALLTGNLLPFSGFSIVARWPNGIVPYVYDSSVVDAASRSAFEAACREWEQQANVRFVPRTTQANYLTVRSSDNNSSYVGMIGGAQEINIYNWTYKFIICHELAHALGAIHEQCRSDRDNYVFIKWENIQAGTENNFAIISNSLNQGNYDFDSVMHYGLTSFSKNGQSTIQPKVNYNSLIGQRDHLSPSDKTGMAALYGPVGPIQRPTNDDFVAAMTLKNARGSVTSLSVNATKQPGEPQHAGNIGGASLWCRWIAPASGPCVISTSGSTTPLNSILDTLLAVYVANKTSSVESDPFYGLIEIARNDDEVTNSLYTSRIQFNAQAGVEYFFAVDGYDGVTGNIVFNWHGQAAIVRPTNDDFQNAQVISSASGSVNGSNVNATKESSEPGYNTAGGASVWYAWAAPQRATYSFQLTTSNFNAVARVFQLIDTTSTPIGSLSLNELAQLYASNSSMAFDAVAGGRYYIVVDGVDGVDGATGTFTLTWQRTQAVTGRSIRGIIKTSIGTPVANVPVQLTGARSATSTSNVNGQYSFTGLSAGTYTVQPASAAYTFGPPGWSIELGNDNMAGADFLAVGGTILGGRVTDRNGDGLSGVIVTCKGRRFSSTTSTSTEGFYAFPGMANGIYTVKAAKSRVKFVPGSHKLALSTDNQTNNNFVAK
jgi:hypothetical protein